MKTITKEQALTIAKEKIGTILIYDKIELTNLTSIPKDYEHALNLAHFSLWVIRRKEKTDRLITIHGLKNLGIFRLNSYTYAYQGVASMY